MWSHPSTNQAYGRERDRRSGGYLEQRYDRRSDRRSGGSDKSWYGSGWSHYSWQHPPRIMTACHDSGMTQIHSPIVTESRDVHDPSSPDFDDYSPINVHANDQEIYPPQHNGGTDLAFDSSGYNHNLLVPNAFDHRGSTSAASSSYEWNYSRDVAASSCQFFPETTFTDIRDEWCAATNFGKFWSTGHDSTSVWHDDNNPTISDQHRHRIGPHHDERNDICHSHHHDDDYSPYDVSMMVESSDASYARIPASPDQSYFQHHPARRSTGSKDDVLSNYGEHDVLCGRAIVPASHGGNQFFRSLIVQHQSAYVSAKRHDKSAIAMSIVQQIRDRGGRFVKKNRIRNGQQQAEGIGQWKVLSSELAYDKVCQALRGGSNDTRSVSTQKETQNR